MNILEVDKNFKVEKINKPDIRLYDVHDEPFELYGLYQPKKGEKFKRIPTEIAEKVNEGVLLLHANTSGGRVRFKTDSQYVIVKSVVSEFFSMIRIPVTGAACFDLYADGHFCGTFLPVDGLSRDYEACIEFEDIKMRDIIINFPTYNNVESLYIGLKADAQLCEGNKYKNEKPVVFYGSSITQGGCTSHSGNIYQNIMSRWLNFDYVNLGFSGSAKGEKVIAEYISNIDMSVFVYDYDHNAPTAEHLKNTHYIMFKTIRDKHPEMPIIIATNVSHCFTKQANKERFEIIEATYKKAVADGDKNIYFINGHDILNSIDPEIFTMDRCHPNDFGFYCMAKEFAKVLVNLI